MIINATVISVNRGNLLVRDLRNEQEIHVNFRNSNRFSAGDNIRITSNGRMTHSIPPQIFATSIQLVQSTESNPSTPPRPPQSIPSETRAIILQRGRDFLLVRDLRNNRQMRVNYAFSHHFCVRQRIIVRHDTIIMNNPPEINAISITPIC